MRLMSSGMSFGRTVSERKKRAARFAQAESVNLSSVYCAAVHSQIRTAMLYVIDRSQEFVPKSKRLHSVARLLSANSVWKVCLHPNKVKIVNIIAIENCPSSMAAHRIDSWA